jgi:hypothetical protein
VRMEGYGGPAQPSPTIGQCINGGLGWLEASLNVGPVGRARVCGAGAHDQLTETQTVTPYKWVHPDEEEGR